MLKHRSRPPSGRSKKAGMKIDDIDLNEVKEALASEPLAWLKALGADRARLDVNGGAIALGLRDRPLIGYKVMAEESPGFEVTDGAPIAPDWKETPWMKRPF